MGEVTGLTAAAMAEIRAGGLVWRGAWNPLTTYVVRDAVTYEGSSYRRKVAGTTVTAPSADATNWELIAAKGDQGIQGIQGNPGPAGADGADGVDGDINTDLLAADVITWAGDTNLYRDSANRLRTDDEFQSATLIRANSGVAARVGIGAVGPGGVAGIIFGSADDVSLYRSAADVLKTDDTFIAGGIIYSDNDIVSRDGTSAKVVMGNEGPSGEPGFKLGSAGDVNLYRSAANFLKTDDLFVAVGGIRSSDVSWANYGSVNEVGIGHSGVGTGAAIYFGSAGDTNIYRGAANQLKTDDTFIAPTIYSLGRLQTGYGGNYIEMGDVGPAGALGFSFLGDVNIYRSAANILKTDDSFEALTVNIKTTGALAMWSNVPAASRAFENYLLSADANPAFRIYGDGDLWWGAGGASAMDTNLYRSGANQLKTDDSLVVVGTIEAGVVYGSAGAATQVGVGGVAGVGGNAGLNFGSAGDTNLYRSAANTLATDDSLKVGNNTGTLYPVLRVVSAGAGQKMNYGSGQASFSASANSAQLTIAHGLGVTPGIVLLTAASPANARCSIQESATADATNIYVTGYQSQGTAITTTQNFYWMAIASG